jgi:O-antigen ligase
VILHGLEASQEAHEALYEEPVRVLVEWWVSTGMVGFLATVGLIAWLAHKKALPWQRRDGK